MAAAGILVGGVSMGSAKAADLGGDCCADLEERVAELEATTARKGNRKMSLTISGQINRVIMWGGNSTSSRTFAGIDSTSSSSRFSFSGAAKINPSMSAGYDMMIEWAPTARSTSVSFTNIDASNQVGTTTSGGDGVLAIRTANWWLEDKVLGRVTVGRIDLQGPVGTIDLGGVAIVAPYSPTLLGGGLAVAGSTLSAFVHPTVGGDRIEGVRYNSQSFAGLTLQAAWGESNVWSASAKYAAEFGGFQVAAGIGVSDTKSDLADGSGALDTSATRERQVWSGSLALRHVASGIFAQGMYSESKYKAGTLTSGGTASAQTFTASFYHVQAGVSKNWFGPGATAPYAEVGRGTDYGRVTAGVASTDAQFFGLGVVQNIDAAAMELFIGWRRFDAERVTAATVSETLDVVTGGARIKF